MRLRDDDGSQRDKYGILKLLEVCPSTVMVANASHRNARCDQHPIHEVEVKIY